MSRENVEIGLRLSPTDVDIARLFGGTRTRAAFAKAFGYLFRPQFDLIRQPAAGGHALTPLSCHWLRGRTRKVLRVGVAPA